jgi:hypothetical protein
VYNQLTLLDKLLLMETIKNETAVQVPDVTPTDTTMAFENSEAAARNASWCSQ